MPRISLRTRVSSRVMEDVPPRKLRGPLDAQTKRRRRKKAAAVPEPKQGDDKVVALFPAAVPAAHTAWVEVPLIAVKPAMTNKALQAAIRFAATPEGQHLNAACGMMTAEELEAFMRKVFG